MRPHPAGNCICTDRHDAGAVIGSFEAWLLIRGMRTLPLRIQRMSESALKVAHFLHAHPKVETVLYPGLPSDPGHETASRQMVGGFGCLLSCQLKGGKSAALSAIGKLHLFKRATSLGGVESLVEHRPHDRRDPYQPIFCACLSASKMLKDLIADLETALG